MPQLRQYQADLVERVRRSWRTGHKAPCIVLPCGGGKSVIVAEIAKKTAENGGRVLFLVHRKELCEQIERTFTWWGVDMTKCSVCMVQTACRRLDKMPEPKLIITDENHHSKASSYRKIYDRFPQVYRVGVTATPVRLDGSGLADVNDDLIVGVSARELIDMNCLADYDYFAPPVADLAGLRSVRGEYAAADIEKRLSGRKIYGDVIKHYKKLADGVQAICYCATIKHSKQTAKQFTAAGIPAAHIDGDTPKQERADIVEKFRQGKITILCNVDLISEGFDVPDCGCVIMLRPTKSLTLFIQQAMRCMRPKPGKRAVIIDHVGNYSRHGMPDDAREWSLQGKKKQDTSEEQKYTTCLNCYSTFRAGRRVCPNCGAELPKNPRPELEQQPAKLEKITGFKVSTKTAAECTTYGELLAYAKVHGYKPGWAYYEAKRRGWVRNKRA